MPGTVEHHPAPSASASPPAPLLDEIVSSLSSETKESRAHVFIEAPAGRGKSALLRAVVERLLTNFETNPSSPLPVLCPRMGSELEKIVAEELGRHGFSDAVVKAQLKRGLFVVAADALDETAWPADGLKRIITGPYEDARVVVASRPSAARREAFSHAERWKRVEPTALDKDTIAQFEAAYLAADQRAGKPSHALDDRMRSLCRIDEAHYSPLLVRFAMRSPDDQIGNVYGLYEQVLRALLRPDDPSKADELLGKAGALCKDTHWSTGQRQLTDAEVSKHREIVDALKKAAILAPVGDRADVMRFFHASAQSFLTARGLALEADETVLARAAGDPRFQQERSDLLGGPGSDLFFFLVKALSPEVVRDRLEKKLADWNGKIGNDLGRRLLVEATPDAIGASFEPWLASAGNDKSTSVILTEMTARIAKLAEPARSEALIKLFAAVAQEAYQQETALVKVKPDAG